MRSAPLVAHIRPQVWKKGQLAYWERMAVRVNILHQTHHKKVAQDLLTMLQALPQQATDDLEQGLFATLLDTWVKHPQNDPTELKRVIQHQEQQAHKALLSSGGCRVQSLVGESSHSRSTGALS